MYTTANKPQNVNSTINIGSLDRQIESISINIVEYKT